MMTRISPARDFRGEYILARMELLVWAFNFLVIFFALFISPLSQLVANVGKFMYLLSYGLCSFCHISSMKRGLFMD